MPLNDSTPSDGNDDTEELIPDLGSDTGMLHTGTAQRLGSADIGQQGTDNAADAVHTKDLQTASNLWHKLFSVTYRPSPKACLWGIRKSLKLRNYSLTQSFQHAILAIQSTGQWLP